MDVRLPNGKVITNVPEDISQDELRIIAIQNGLATGEDFGEQSSAVAQIPKEDSVTSQFKGLPPGVEPAANPSALDMAIQGATAVPIMAALGRGAQLATKGSKIAPYTASIAQSLLPQSGKALLAEGALGAASGVAGGYAAQAAPEGYQEPASMVAGMAVAAPFSLGKNLFDLWASRGMVADLGAAGISGSQAVGTMQAQRQLSVASKANPNLIPSIQRASQIEQVTGVSLPALAASNGDTTISAFLQGQIARGENAAFTAQLRQQYIDAEAALKKAQGGIAPSMQAVDAYVKRKAQVTANMNKATEVKVQQAAERRTEGLDRINQRIQELSRVEAPGVENIGARLTSLVDAKESAIRGELSPLYDELINKSIDAGIKLPGESAKNLRDFAIDERNSDVFAKFPSLYSQITKVFKPTTPTSGKFAEKYPQLAGSQQGVFKDYSLKDVDSLKRAVNKAMRSTKDPDQLRVLGQLKNEVDNAVNTIDPSFSNPYRELDRQYAVKLGIPFNEQGVIKINNARFVEDSVPVLTKNPSALKQSLAIIGDNKEGLKIVEDAFMLDISQSRGIINTSTGELNPKQLDRYLKDNKEMIDLVPGLRAKLEGLKDSVAVLGENRTRLLKTQKDAQIEKAENIWSQASTTTDGMRGIVRNSLRTPQGLTDLVNTVRKDPVALAGVKSAFIEDILTAPGDRMVLLQEHKDAMSRLFTKQEAKDIEALIEYSQRLKDNPFVFRVNINTINKDNWEKTTGSPLSTSLGEARNQVMTAPRVFINHLTRFFQRKSTDAENAEIQRLLMDKEALRDAADLLAEVNDKGFTNKAAALTGRLFKNTTTTYLLGGMSGLLQGAQQEPAAPYQPVDSGLLQGYQEGGR